MKQAYLLTITGDERTRFDADPEFIRAELQAFASRLIKFYSRGSIPAVNVLITPECSVPKLPADFKAGY